MDDPYQTARLIISAALGALAAMHIYQRAEHDPEKYAAWCFVIVTAAAWVFFHTVIMTKKVM